MRLRGLGSAVLCLMFMVPVAVRAQPAPVPPPVPDGVESLRLRVVNAAGGTIDASRDQGHTWLRLGTVTQPADRVNPASFTAAMWAHSSAIAATATNALHIEVAQNPQTGRPMTISIVPGGRVIGAADRQLSSAIFTDIPGGTSIFGGGLGPYVNSPVLLANQDPPSPLSATYQPAIGDILLIIRSEPALFPRYAVFENRPGGSVELDYGQGPVRVGIVDREVSGIGRFEGSLYAAAGRIRANHPGVIDISTSPYGVIGGLQIIPRRHASSPEMSFVKTGHQWMVVGPDKPDDPDWAGLPPFFSGSILPSYRYDDIFGEHADWMKRLLSRTLVQVRYSDGPWEPMPRIGFAVEPGRDNEIRSQRGRCGLWLIPGAQHLDRPLPQDAAAIANHALDGVTHLRIVFPQSVFWPEEGQTDAR